MRTPFPGSHLTLGRAGMVRQLDFDRSVLHSLEVVSRTFHRFIGVDLGGGKGKTTAVARLALDEAGGVRVEEVTAKAGKLRQATPFYDDVLLAYLERWREDAVVAIDAPL